MNYCIKATIRAETYEEAKKVFDEWRTNADEVLLTEEPTAQHLPALTEYGSGPQPPGPSRPPQPPGSVFRK